MASPEPYFLSPLRADRLGRLRRACRIAAVIVAVAVVVPIARATPTSSLAGAAAPAVAQPAAHPAAAPASPSVPAAVAAPAPRAVPAAPPRPAIERVTAARPTAFRATGPGFDVSSRVCAMPNAMVLDPPGNPRKQVCWVEAPMGEKPGSASATTYILGHSYANDAHTVLGTLSRVASAPIAHGRTVYRSGVPTRTITALAGTTLTLRTATGVLTYRVGLTFAVPKPQFGLVQRIEDDTLPRRVVLVTCAVLGGRDLDYNVIVEAKLVAAHPLP